MYCASCGTENAESAQSCSSCGAAIGRLSTPPPVPSTPVKNYLTQAIIVTICCCVPLGIPAIVFAARVNAQAQAGDMAAAMDSSAKARMWAWIAFGAGILSLVIWIPFAIIGALAEGDF